MNHQVKDFSHLIGHLPGMTDRQVETHLGLYAGYVKKLNEIQEKLTTTEPTESNYSYGAFSELKLTKNQVDGLLHTYILFEHNINFPVHNNVLMALDCWEHAFAIDYGTDKPKYVENFLKVVDWEVVAKRFAEL